MSSRTLCPTSERFFTHQRGCSRTRSRPRSRDFLSVRPDGERDRFEVPSRKATRSDEVRCRLPVTVYSSHHHLILWGKMDASGIANHDAFILGLAHLALHLGPQSDLS